MERFRPDQLSLWPKTVIIKFDESEWTPAPPLATPAFASCWLADPVNLSSGAPVRSTTEYNHNDYGRKSTTVLGLTSPTLSHHYSRSQAEGRVAAGRPSLLP